LRKIYDPKSATFYNDIAFGFIATLRLINNAIDKNAKAKEIKKLLNNPNFHILHKDKITNRKVIAEFTKFEFKHEETTAVKLNSIGFDVIFAPKGMFSRKDKKFDVFLAKDNILLKADLKFISSTNPDTIQNRIMEGANQATRVVLDIESNILPHKLIDGLRNGIKNCKPQLIEIVLFYRNGYYKLPTSLIMSKKIYELIK
jgi:hypothetical protein